MILNNFYKINDFLQSSIDRVFILNSPSISCDIIFNNYLLCSVLDSSLFQVWRLENEFYNFALDHFHFLRKKTLVEAEEGGRLVDRGQKFAYEKIKPKRS